MMWAEWFNTAAGAASLMGLILAVVLGLVTWRLTRATDKLIAQGDARTQEMLTQGDARTQDLLARMDERWQQAWERMDQRADERHRDTIEAIRTLRG